MTSETAYNVRSRSDYSRASAERDEEYSDEESNVHTHNTVSTRPPGSGPSIQSTVKVEGRKENAVDRYKVIIFRYSAKFVCE